MQMSTPWEEQPTKASGMLNVLTILTFIGSGLQIIGSVMNFITAKTTYDSREEQAAQMFNENVPSAVKNMMGTREEFLEMIIKNYENRLPIMILGLLGAALCIYGAIQMRSLKKQGFPIYVVGQAVPIIGNVVLISAASILSVSGMIGLVIPVLFIILYFTQRKQLIY
jgi:hypothetical protein